MTVEHIRALESIGFEWDPSADSWNEQFEQLRKFVVQFGHSVVPLRYSAIPKLGQWVFTQRGNYRLYLRGKSNPMTAERIQKLETVEFKWERNSVSRSEQPVARIQGAIQVWVSH